MIAPVYKEDVKIVVENPKDYYLGYNAWTDKWELPTFGYPNGFVRDSKGDGLVYRPDADTSFIAPEPLIKPDADTSSTAPEPLNQPKSSDGLVDATIKAQIRLNRLLMTPNKIGLTFCDVGAKLLKDSYFLKSYNKMADRCSICSQLERNRKVHYFNGDDGEIYYQGQTVEDLIDVDYCEIILPPELMVLPDTQLHDTCLQGLCKSYKSTYNNDKSAKCSAMFSIIVGFKTSLEICEKQKFPETGLN